MSEYWQSAWQTYVRTWGVAGLHRLVEIVTLHPETGSRWTVAHVGGSDDPEAIGIAHLIEAAPDLRAALSALVDFVQDVCPDEVLESDERFKVLFDFSRAALAKAGTAGLTTPAGTAAGAPGYEARRVQPPDQTDGPVEVESYGDVAQQRWQQNRRYCGGIFGRGVHHPYHDCFTCADGRALAGLPSIKPVLAREALRRQP